MTSKLDNCNALLYGLPKYTIQWRLQCVLNSAARLVTLSRKHVTCRKNSLGVYIFQIPFLRSLSTEGNLRFKIDWTSLIVWSKFTVFALFYFVFNRRQFSKCKPPGGLYLDGRFNGGFFALPVWGVPIFGGAYFRNFTVFLTRSVWGAKTSISHQKLIRSWKPVMSFWSHLFKISWSQAIWHSQQMNAYLSNMA